MSMLNPNLGVFPTSTIERKNEWRWCLGGRKRMRDSPSANSHLLCQLGRWCIPIAFFSAWSVTIDDLVAVDLRVSFVFSVLRTLVAFSFGYLTAPGVSIWGLVALRTLILGLGSTRWDFNHLSSHFLSFSRCELRAIPQLLVGQRMVNRCDCSSTSPTLFSLLIHKW